jgi:uncharacterized Fe-S cluster protein YjdI
MMKNLGNIIDKQNQYIQISGNAIRNLHSGNCTFGNGGAFLFNVNEASFAMLADITLGKQK